MRTKIYVFFLLVVSVVFSLGWDWPSKTKAKEKYDTGVYYYKNGKYVEAVECFRFGDKAGLSQAQHYLGLCYLYGKGVRCDEKVGAEFIRKAAEDGLAEAQLTLADCFYRGLGVPKDDKKAIYWIEQAVAQESIVATFRLGLLYKNGTNFLEQDYKKAASLFRKAIKLYGKPPVEGSRIMKELEELEKLGY